MKYVLIVSNHPGSSWLKAVSQALLSLAKIDIVTEHEALTKVEKKDYDLLLIDTSNIVSDVVTLVVQLHNILPDLPIIVFTLSPTWQRAREVFLAGARDYVGRTLDEEKLRKICEEAWDKGANNRGRIRNDHTISGQ